MSDDQYQVESKTLIRVLREMLGADIVDASCQAKELQGGTLGDVRLVTGEAETSDGERLPYKFVIKVQEKWERPGDPNSWRREYDLYTSDFVKVFTDSLRWPKHYHAQMNDDEAHLWLEYIDGISGDRFDIQTLEFVATDWGRLQGELYKQPEISKYIEIMSEPDALRRNYEQWHRQTFSYEFLISEQCRMPEFLKQMLRDGEIQLQDGKTFEYSYLRSRGCSIPGHLRQMIYDIDDNRDAVFDSLKQLPVVLCHRDFWVENIFVSDGKIRLIDWDSAGFGYLGEDIASLIYDDIATSNLLEYFSRLIPAYTKSLSKYVQIPKDFNKYVLQIILIVFGYRMVQGHMFTQSPEEKEEQVMRLQSLYDLRDM